MSALVQKQMKFARLRAELVSWIFSHDGWAVTEAEGYVGDTDAADGDYDGPHLRRGGHYRRIAADLNLWVNGVLVPHYSPEWDVIGEHWESLDPDCRWGGRFKSKDYNHFSLEHEGVS